MQFSLSFVKLNKQNKKFVYWFFWSRFGRERGIYLHALVLRGFKFETTNLKPTILLHHGMTLNMLWVLSFLFFGVDMPHIWSQWLKGLHGALASSGAQVSFFKVYSVSPVDSKLQPNLKSYLLLCFFYHFGSEASPLFEPLIYCEG